MSKRSSAVRRSTASSAGVSRSRRSVARAAALSRSATARLRGLCRPLPLPWAKITSPRACSGTVSDPARLAFSISMVMSRRDARMITPRVTLRPALEPARGRQVARHSPAPQRTALLAGCAGRRVSCRAGPMGSLPKGKWTTDPPTNPNPLWVRIVGFLLLVLLIGGALYSQGFLKLDQIVQPGVQASPTPTATTQHR